MAIRGKRPKPTTLHLIQGTGRPQRLKARGKEATTAPISNTDKPDYLTGRASKLWDEVVPKLYWLVNLDRFKLGQWCALQARFEQDPVAFPIGLYAPLRLLGSELAMDPTSRARLGDKLRAPGNGKRDTSKFF